MVSVFCLGIFIPVLGPCYAYYFHSSLLMNAIKKWSIVPDQIRTNNSLLFEGTIAFCSQGRCGSHAEITTKSSLKIVKFSALQTFFLGGGGSVDYASVMLFSLGY